MSCGHEFGAAEDKKEQTERHGTRVPRRMKMLFFLKNVLCSMASTIATPGALTCFSLCNAYRIVCHHASHGAYTDGAARIPINARAITKPDESMNPYESTMNPIQKTDESMNPSYLMK